MRAIEVVAVLRYARQVDDAVVGAARDVGRLDVLVVVAIVVVVRRRLADVVEARPDELARDKAVLLHAVELDVGNVAVARSRHVKAVRLEDIARNVAPRLGGRHLEKTDLAVGAARFGVDDRLVGIGRLHRHVALRIVPARQIQVGKARHRDGLPGGDADGARHVLAPHRLAEHPAPLARHAGRILLRADRHLVADRPRRHARVVAVAADERLQVAADILLEIGRAARHRIVPLVEALVPDDEAHPVAEVEELRRRCVVRGADRVNAHVLQNAQLAFRRRLVEDHAERTEVRMQAHALQLQATSVQPESVVCRELHRADAVGEFLPQRLKLVELGLLHAPKPRLLDDKGRVGRSVQRRDIGHVHRRAREVGGRLGDDLHRAGDHVVLRLHHKMHAPVDSRTGIPAGEELRGVGGDFDQVFAGRQQLADVKREGHVAVVPATGRMSVDRHRRMRLHAVKREVRLAARLQRLPLFRRQHEGAAVHAPSLPRQLAAVRAIARRLGIERRDAPVVRNRYLRPARSLAAKLPDSVQCPSHRRQHRHQHHYCNQFFHKPIFIIEKPALRAG